MKLTLKTTLALLLGFSALLVAYGLRELDRRKASATEQLRASQRTLGYLFRPGIARTWRIEGPAAALYLIEYTEQTLQESTVDSAFELRWVWLDAGGDDPHAPLAGAERVPPGEEVSLILDGDHGDQMVTYVPVDSGIDNERPGALEIVGSVAGIDAQQARARRRLMTTAAIGAGALGLLSLAIGAWFVGRPVQRLVTATTRIGEGHLDTRTNVRRRDELGRIARSIDSMAGALARARDKADRETRARIRAVEQMRHADRLATVGKLASGMAHELGTPLAVVSGRARLIANRTVEGDEMIRYAESIENQAEKMARIIRQLLDFARRRAVTLTPKDVRVLIAHTAELLETVATKRGVTLRLEIGGEPQLAPVDGTQLEQVLTNLVVNAIQASSAGDEVVIALDTSSCDPPPGTDAQPGQYLRIAVSDRGAGMSAETMERVFEPFFTTKDVGEGTGLGLSVSHGIIEAHGGWLSVDSALGEGTRFVVHLPLHPHEVA